MAREDEERREMGSLAESVGVPNVEEPHCAVVMLLDTSTSMAGGKLDQLNRALKDFWDAVLKDPIAAKRIDAAIVSFGGDPTVVQDFSCLEDREVPSLQAGGATPMGSAIEMAINLIENRKQMYRTQGVEYYRPWIVLITDGEPTDIQLGEPRWSEIVHKVRSGVELKQFVFLAVVVAPGNLELMREISHPERPALRLDGYKFSELFLWLSRSLGKVAKSRVGDQIQLDPISKWAELD